MKFAAVIAALATVAAAHYDNVTYVTETVTALTTYCPGPTKIVHGGKTITVTEVRGCPGGAGELECESREIYGTSRPTARRPAYAGAWLVG